MTTIFARIEAFLKNDLTSIESFFAGEVWPAVKTFFQTTIEEEVQALLPILEKALPSVILDAGMLFTPSGWAAGVTALIGTAESTIAEMATAGKQVAAESIHTAVGAVLANAKAAYLANPPATIAAPPAA